MNKILIGVATAAAWFALSYAAHAERVCRQVCDNGTCVSKCVEHPDSDVIIHEHDHGPPPDADDPGAHDDDTGR